MVCEYIPCNYPVGQCLELCSERFWPGTNVVKSKGNAFDWRNQDRSDLNKWMDHLAYVKRGVENASKKVAKDAGLTTAENVLFKTNIIAFSRAKSRSKPG